MDFEGKVVVVTGGANGIGRATCLSFQKEGALLVVVDKDPVAGEETVTEIEQNGGKAIFVPANVEFENDVETSTKHAIREFGRIDVLINNAGIGHDGTVEEDEPKIWDHVLAVNLRSVYLCCHFMIPEIRKSGNGAIVNVGSAQSCAATPRSAAYVTSKFGILGLTKAMAVDHAPEIRVNAVLPGSTDTSLFHKGALNSNAPKEFVSMAEIQSPLERIAKPKEIAEVILFLASDRASFINGTGVLADGGLLAKIRKI